MISLAAELKYFNKVEERLIKEGWDGYFVIIHDHQILAKGKSPGEAVEKLLARYEGKNPPEPLLVRQILGDKRKPIRMRSPRTASHTP